MGCFAGEAEQVGGRGTRFPSFWHIALPRGAHAGVSPRFLGWLRAECGQQWRQDKGAGREWAGCK